MHAPLQTLKAPVQPVRMQLPVEQLATPLGNMHGAPQAPQLAVVVIDVSQPSTSSAGVPQVAKPAAHALCGTTQRPALQETAAPAFKLGSVVQSRSQLPQCLGSVWVLTQLAPHRLGVGETQLEEQTGAPVIVEHRPRGATQRLVQLPQVLVLVKLVSHPSLPAALQCPNPLTHAEGCTTHPPPTHCTAGGAEPDFTLRRVLQSKPHAPQFL